MTALKGRTVALVGLDRAELLDVSAAIDGAGGDWQAFGRTPEAAKLRAFDVLVTRAVIADAGVPQLVIGQSDADGASDFILPPVRAEELVLRIQRLLEIRTQTTQRAAVSETPVVLTADDDPTTTAIVRAVVTQNAMTCHVARDGREAFERARELVPDAIVLDVNMPFRDGFEVLSALRSEPRTAAIPVLMLTSVQQEVDVVKGFRLGADDYVAKPFNPMELLARIKRLVRKA
jgi:PleD family two-component response regulator